MSTKPSPPGCGRSYAQTRLPLPWSTRCVPRSSSSPTTSWPRQGSPPGAPPLYALTPMPSSRRASVWSGVRCTVGLPSARKPCWLRHGTRGTPRVWSGTGYGTANASPASATRSTATRTSEERFRRDPRGHARLGSGRGREAILADVRRRLLPTPNIDLAVAVLAQAAGMVNGTGRRSSPSRVPPGGWHILSRSTSAAHRYALAPSTPAQPPVDRAVHPRRYVRLIQARQTREAPQRIRPDRRTCRTHHRESHRSG